MTMFKGLDARGEARKVEYKEAASNKLEQLLLMRRGPCSKPNFKDLPSQMRSYGEKVTDETVVAKVLRSLDPKFDHVVATIKESKDLSVFSFDELMQSFQAHEDVEEAVLEVVVVVEAEIILFTVHILTNMDSLISFVGPNPRRQRLQLLKNKHMVNDLPDIRSLTHVCEGCALGKQAKSSFPVRKSKRANDVLELIHADLCGPMKSESLAGSETKSLMVLFVGDPITLEEAFEKEEWIEAMKDELVSIHRNQTWELVDPPEGKNVISFKWVFKTKFLADGSIQKHKARLVVRGCSQPRKVLTLKKFLLQLRALRRLDSYLLLKLINNGRYTNFDVKLAFLNGDLQEEVYVCQPPRFENLKEENKVYRLKKALYGLKQSPRAWYNKIDKFFHENGFERSQHEPTLYIKRQGTDLLIVSLYVDDMIYTGELIYFLGLEINQNATGIFMCQKKYIEDTLNKFSMRNCKIAATPMNIGEKLSLDNDSRMAYSTLYKSLVGRLIYVTHSQPDIAFSVGMSKDFCLKGFSDSDWAGSIDDRRSTSGSCFVFGSTVVSWSSKKQATVALSTSEAEYVAAATTACQAIWLRRVLAELGGAD
uniref:Retrovirus-related Pol polyprotein from transposon TNT 1-94 n=1 Tax=Tanacetum cinerariifolium TaxID=118510 RepID=A0A6L2MC11_TANCI|nr:retrovirus-related Pol polyprotein from transposon TNT 1-94 [Tanacetum cinerariifolium]